MASSFKFGFQSDDIDEEISDNDTPHEQPNTTKPETQDQNAKSNIRRAAGRPKLLTLDELLARLPSQIFYNTLKFKLFRQEKYLTVPRRDVLDGKIQLMAEADDVEETGDSDLAHDLETFDVKKDLYEGGSKTWESSIDLAAVLAADYDSLFSEEAEEIRVIELGSGPAIPALALLRSIFQAPKPSEPPRRKIRFVLSDFNLIYLYLFTLPNVLLTWYISRNPADNPEPTSELDINSQLLDDFRADLAAYGVSFRFISGPWSPEWVDLAFPQPNGGEIEKEPAVGRGYTLVFSSETIYATETMPDFVSTLVSLLERAGERQQEPSSSHVAYQNPTALIAAKKLYFGVGGGVDHFIAVLNELAGERVHVSEKEDIADEGVGRGVWEVELNSRKT